MQRKGQVNLRAIGSELANSGDDAHRRDLSKAYQDVCLKKGAQHRDMLVGEVKAGVIMHAPQRCKHRWVVVQRLPPSVEEPKRKAALVVMSCMTGFLVLHAHEHNVPDL